MPTKCKYYLVDAFTSTPFQGAQVAVFVDASDLDGKQMQLIATELNLSETLFIQRDAVSEIPWCFRVFSPQQELDFAGHTIIAGCHVLSNLNRLSDGISLIRQNLGNIEVSSERQKDRALRIGFSIPSPVRFDDFVPSPRDLADILHLDENDIDQGEYRARISSCGNDYLIIPIKSCTALERARFNDVKWTLSFIATLASQILLFCVNRSAEPVDFNLRLLGKGIADREDPPVGSAVPAFAAYMFDTHGEGHHRAVLQRGGGERRRSILHMEVIKSHGHFEKISVAGYAAQVGEGEILVP